MSSCGAYTVESVAAFEAIGAHRAAAILRRVLEYFPRGVPPRDDVERAALVERLMRIACATWDELGTALLAQPDDLASLLDTYERTHAAAFRALEVP